MDSQQTILSLAPEEDRLLNELIEGLVHEFPLCCILEYCSDIYLHRDSSNPAIERGIVYFRTFSLHRAENLFNGIDKVDVPDHYVPCGSCSKRLAVIKVGINDSP